MRDRQLRVHADRFLETLPRTLQAPLVALLQKKRPFRHW